MKKITTLLVTIISIVLAVVLTGCNHDDAFTKQAYSSGESKIDALTIDVQDREIEVSVSEDNQVHIDYFESEKEYYDLSVTENNLLTMDFVQNKEWSDFIGTKPKADFRKIIVKIPQSLLSGLTIITTNGKISLSKIAVSESITLSSNGGNIDLEQIDVGKALTLTTKNGDIQGTVIGSYDVFSIACTIKKGECNLPIQKADGEKSLKVNCNNGDINIDFVKL